MARPDRSRPEPSRSPVLASVAVGGVAGVSRILGFARDVLTAAALGTGPAADAFLVAARLPNLLRRTVSEGGLNAGLVPLHARMKAEEGEEAAAALAGEALAALALGLALVVAVVEIAAGAVVLLLAAGYLGEPETYERAVAYTRLAAPALFGVGLAALVSALLAAERFYLAAALPGLVVNGVLIAVLTVLRAAGVPPDAAAGRLAAALALGGLLQLALTLAAARGRVRWRLAWPRPSPALRRLTAAAGLGLLASLAGQLMIVAGLQVASGMPSGVSWLHFADRVFQLPLGFVGSAAGLVLISEAAARQAAGDGAALAAAQNRACEGALLLSLPAAAALAWLSAPIARVLFQHGAFGPADAAGTAAALAGLAPGLPLAALASVLSQTCFVRGEARAAVLAGGAGVLAAALAGLALAPVWGILGVGLGVAGGFAVQAGLLAAGLRRAGPLAIDARLKDRIPRAAAATAAMAAVLAGLESLVGREPPGGWAADAAWLMVRCLVGLGAYALFAAAFGALRPAEWRTPASDRLSS